MSARTISVPSGCARGAGYVRLYDLRSWFKKTCVTAHTVVAMVASCTVPLPCRYFRIYIGLRSSARSSSCSCNPASSQSATLFDRMAYQTIFYLDDPNLVCNILCHSAEAVQPRLFRSCSTPLLALAVPSDIPNMCSYLDFDTHHHVVGRLGCT